MSAAQDKILALLDQPQLSDEDVQWIVDYIDAEDHNSEFQVIVQERFFAKLEGSDVGQSQRAVELLKQMHERMGIEDAPAIPVHRIHFLRTAWLRYAAVLIIAIGTIAYLWNNTQKEKPSVTQVNPVPVANDVAPGGNRATLTLADGRRINLDSAANGTIANENQAAVIKSGDGKIEYKATGEKQDVVSYNTMTTPRGGQYQLRLPDGSQVWLNAASSITYPTAFTGKTREVSVTGEVYFEVAHNKLKPFIVTAGKQSIQVLGTHFNVNTYADETTMNTTLLEGSVRIKTVHTSLTLKPGQQGQLDPANDKLSLAANPDVEQAMAWKNGLFNFNNADLPAVMRQLERWYDITVKYNTSIPKMTFKGELDRGLNLGDVLEILKHQDIKFKVENRTLFIE